MKITVANAFFDKNTGLPYNRGEIFESEDQKRIAELRAGGYLAQIATTVEAVTTEHGDNVGDPEPKETGGDDVTAKKKKADQESATI